MTSAPGALPWLLKAEDNVGEKGASEGEEVRLRGKQERRSCWQAGRGERKGPKGVTWNHTDDNNAGAANGRRSTMFGVASAL